MKSTSQMRSRQDSSQQWKGLHTCCHSDTWLRKLLHPSTTSPHGKTYLGLYMHTIDYSLFGLTVALVHVSMHVSSLLSPLLLLPLLSLSPPPSPFPLLSLSSSHVPSPSHLFPSFYSLPPSSLVTPCGLTSIPAV